MNYDFSQLNDKEFEELTVDLLAELYDVRIERFKSGKDGGIDGRFFINTKDEAIIQCKHYIKTSYKGMINKLKKEEVEKVHKLKPKKYIFVTPHPLSPVNKYEIQKIFSPYITCQNDIFGMEDLNDLIKNQPKIELRYFKLWISSSEVLNRFLNNAVIGRSRHEIERIGRSAKKFVQTSSYTDAIEKLNAKKILIITGEPGIGKTTLAENVCLSFALKGYELIDVQESIKDAEDVYVDGRKQIFYFDDFLGSNYFEAIENKKDSSVVKFIDRVKHDNTKLFILTSRTTILNSGVYYSAVFSNVNIRKDEYLLSVDSIRLIDKAKILYNHIWFGDLGDEYVDEIYKNKRYKDVIDHRNFNPRLIEFITDASRVDNITSDKYWSYIEKTLNNPKDIWEDCFKNQNNGFVRGLVNLVVFNGGDIEEGELRKGFYRIVDVENIPSNSHVDNDFNFVIKMAVKSFLKRVVSSGVVTYKLFNPSIADFIIGEYCNDLAKLSGVYRSILTLDSIYHLESMKKDNVISEYFYKELKNISCQESFSENVGFDYKIINFKYMVSFGLKDNRVLVFIDSFISNPVEIKEFIAFIYLLNELHGDLCIKSYSFLRELFSTRHLSYYEIEVLVEFIIKFGITEVGLLNDLKLSIEDYIEDELNDRKSGLELSEFLEGVGDEYVIDEEGVESAIEVLEDGIVSELEVEFDIELIEGLTLDSVSGNIDVDGMIKDYEFYPVSDSGQRDTGFNFSSNDVDDLFDRS
jgi:hypothetical protein